jgi:hypothetical protein
MFYPLSVRAGGRVGEREYPYLPQSSLTNYYFGTHFMMVSNRTDIPKKDSLLASLCACELLLKES